MAGKISSESGEEEELTSEINMIPMIDVMLVLLIIFMVSAPMMNDMVKVDLPEAQAKAATAEEKSVILTIKQDQNLFIGKTPVKYDDLTGTLNGIFQNRTQKEIFLNADKEVKHGFIVQVMANIQKAGIFKISFLTDPSK